MKNLIFVMVYVNTSLAFAGGLDRDQIAEVIQHEQHNTLLCYENQLSKYPKLQGRVALEFFIELDGSVKTSKIHETTLHNEAAENCLINLSKKWIFPKPTGKESVHVTYPFIFERIDHGETEPARAGGGFKLVNVQPGSIYEKLGLLKGDIIKKFNGQIIDSPEAAKGIYEKLQKSPSKVEIVIERDGTEQTLRSAIN